MITLIDIEGDPLVLWPDKICAVGVDPQSSFTWLIYSLTPNKAEKYEVMHAPEDIAIAVRDGLPTPPEDPRITAALEAIEKTKALARGLEVTQ